MAKTSEKEKTQVIAIGASAGGLEAIQEFFKAMPEKTSLAFVVIQHLSPDYKSFMDEILSRVTRLNIKIVTDGIPIEPDSIFLIPPRKNLSIYKDKLFLDDQDNTRGLHLPVDIFFRSLAKEKGKDAIGIVLSGTGSDGTLGTRAIKEAGGMIMVQDENTSKFDGMPRSSIATGLIDFVLPPNEMPKALLDFLRHPFTSVAETKDKGLEKEPDVLSKILMILRDFTDLDFSFYKEKTIIRRLERRLSVNHFQSLDDYIVMLRESNLEKEILYKELLIGVTSFFRDAQAFESISKKVLPEIFKKNKINEPKRIWTAGCSTGEEAYSLAIILLEFIEKTNINPDIKIFATDIDSEAIEIASQGFYPESIVADIAPELLIKYFDRRNNGFQAKERLRKTIIFATHNILRDPPFSKIDLITCRNLFIYLKPEIQQRIFSVFYFALNTNGFLFIGSSESTGEMEQAYETVEAKWKIYRKKEGYQPPVTRGLPAMNSSKSSGSRPVVYQNSNLGESPRLDKMLEMVVGNLIPPSFIIDQDYNILHVINNINKFVQLPPGKFTSNFLSILHEDLRLIVSGMLRKLKTEDQKMYAETIQNAEGFDNKHITIEARRVEGKQAGTGFLIVTFTENEAGNQEQRDEKIIDAGLKESDSYYRLEQELQFTKENLQATVEELETSNEELQSSNEELIASNEELQSTNEELQSVNEELYTVNTEYQNKIEELTQLNSDINNLLRNTNIGTLYLDSKLYIRKFTPIVSGITNIMDMDINRPLQHISVPRNYKEFVDDVSQVLDSLSPIQKEINTEEDRWFLVKIMPYRTPENAVDGVIVTFVDITTLKKERERADKANARLKLAMETGEMAWWEWDIPSGKVDSDHKKPKMLGYDKNEFPTIYSEIAELVHPDDYDAFMHSTRHYLEGKTESYEVTYRILAKNGTYSWFFDKGGVIEWSPDGKPAKLTGISVNITDLKKAEKGKEDNYQLILRILENSPIAKTMVNAHGNIEYANIQARELLGLTETNTPERKFDAPEWKITDVNGNSIPSEQLPFSIIKNSGKQVSDFKHYIQDGQDKKILLKINGTPIFDEDGAFDGAVFALQEENIYQGPNVLLKE